MKKIKELLRRENLSLLSYKKIGNRWIVGTNQGTFVIKKNTYLQKEVFFRYLESRGFPYFLRPIYSTSEYDVYPYIKETSISLEEKNRDLVRILSFLHSRTMYYKKVSGNELEEKYEDLKNRISSLEQYYYEKQDMIEEKEYMSPSEYLLIRNVSSIYQNLNLCKYYLEKWYTIVIEKKEVRNVTLHNNLKTSHLLVGEQSYLINWERTFQASPIYDLYNLYLNTYETFDYDSSLSLYLEKFPLFEEELFFFFLLLLLPEEIPVEKNEVEQCQVTRKCIDLVNSSREFILYYRSKQQKEKQP